MVASEQIDDLLNAEAAKSTAHLEDIVKELVSLAIRYLEVIEQSDQRLLPEEPEEFNRPLVVLLVGMYEDWASRADLLLDRLSRMEKQQGLKIAAVESLRDALGRIKAMLSISVDNMEQTRKELAEEKLVRLTLPMSISLLLVDLEQMERLDAMLMPSTRAALDAAKAAAARGMYESWAARAQTVLERVERHQNCAALVEKYVALRDAHGRIRAMLSVSLEDMEAGRRDVLEGRTIPADVVRRLVRFGRKQ